MPAAASSSSSSAVAMTEEQQQQEILAKFQQLGREAAAEEEADEDDEDDDDDEAGVEGEGVSGAGAAGGAGGEDGAGKKKKKKKKKSKAAKAVDRLKSLASGQAPQELINVVRENMDVGEQAQVTDDEIRRALKAADLMKLLDGKVALGNKSNTKELGEHKFWKTQPVPQLKAASSTSSNNSSALEGPIDEPKTPADVKQEPGALPAGFEWSTIDVKDEEQMVEVHTLLSENYVEDDDAMFRFRYTKEFLLWALTAPGYTADWHIGVRVKKTGKLVAFISGIRVEIRVRAHTIDSSEINFLCVHKKLRSKRLAPVLIKEVTRRINRADVWQAIYTAGVVIPTPFSTCRYFHRNLNPPKLVDIGFSPLQRGMTIARLVRQFAMGSATRLAGFREMTRDDVPQVGALLRRYLARFDVAQTFSKDEDVEHWFNSGQGRDDGSGNRIEQVVWAYVVEDPTTHLITDLVSFYSLPSTIMKHPKHDLLKAAYMFYYASDVIFSAGGSADDAATHDAKAKNKLADRLNELMHDLLVVAQNAGFDVLNALTLMDNNMFLQEQKFGPGDGFLNYYLYNWSTEQVDGGVRGTTNRQGSGVGVVML